MSSLAGLRASKQTGRPADQADLEVLPVAEP
jgi:hypothetical protein